MIRKAFVKWVKLDIAGRVRACQSLGILTADRYANGV